MVSQLVEYSRLDNHSQALTQLYADAALIGDTHCLSQAERMQLTRVIAGAIPVNRDRPVFLLAMSICAAETDDIFDLIVPGQTVLARLDAALLDFIINHGCRYRSRCVQRVDFGV